MMAKLITTCTFLILTLGISATTFTVGGIKYSTTSANTVETISLNTRKYPLYIGDITIPSSVDYSGTYTVTSIGEGAFSECSGLSSIIIPNSVTSIGDGAFTSCSGLTSITITSAITSIESSAFSHCIGLTSITIPNSVTSIGSGAFSGCDALTFITIPSSVTSIGSEAFSYCYGLTSISIPSSVISIGGGAFSSCYNLTSIYAHSKIPVDLNSCYSVFYFISLGCTLYVPSGSLSLYQSAEQWRNFTNMVELTRSFTDTLANDFKVYSGSRIIVVENAGGNTVSVYDITGRMIEEVTSPNTKNIKVDKSGMYMVRVAGKTVKVWVN